MKLGQSWVSLYPVNASSGKINFQVKPCLCVSHLYYPLQLQATWDRIVCAALQSRKNAVLHSWRRAHALNRLGDIQAIDNPISLHVDKMTPVKSQGLNLFAIHLQLDLFAFFAGRRVLRLADRFFPSGISSDTRSTTSL
jgi:hypothetical protein